MNILINEYKKRMDDARLSDPDGQGFFTMMRKKYGIVIRMIFAPVF
ncbi:hypothetical protein PTE_01588 [Photorhabdus khanii NC19]|uniref:Uncharacterized protein n=1 Tax=Photorhabdus khanii NC19 TaxID=1004151 RepID=W3VAX7_9GAMM|nr:hypothetical protein [Photorhabdus khanii]ETS32280.1 hypothetical protein PTE_01588 [Photorhabdus khanii NC19]